MTVITTAQMMIMRTAAHPTPMPMYIILSPPERSSRTFAVLPDVSTVVDVISMNQMQKLCFVLIGFGSHKSNLSSTGN